ncbi:right-handed parallel beta-helix repeat-containing protein [uncultured Bacteroides sp.]|uniref:right-handed parallel beta-helix repeat-containing protein n=1 Tax=uncultured Bacteroides sp. TaxID=162156 RepID=UPI00280A7D0F|nr:right-handed parallel beta-helix repeat-containing protein [uncultured Bacteroides sp.]
MKRIKNLFIIASIYVAGCTSAPPTYYLDATNGDDTNSGLSADDAWKTLKRTENLSMEKGSKLLLKRGETFKGELKITGNGVSQAPIFIDAYGEGKQNPRIIGNDSSMYAVCISNSDYLTIQNLEIINTGKKALAGRTGLKVECMNYGVSHNIRINNITVRDVNGSLVKEEGGGSGILIVNGGDSIRSRFDSLTIENCHILRCARNAIIWNGYYDRKNWYPNTHTIVRKNLIEEVPGDGIVPIGCDSTLIEYNLMCDSPDTLPMTEAAAGIWPWSCDNTIIQYNEVSHHKAPWDAQGFDSDYNCQNTLIQYNYSHDNYGGMVLICNSGEAGDYSCGNIGSIIRYNISIGDGIRPKETRQGMFSPGIHIAGPVKRTLIERNIVHANHKPYSATDRTMITSDSWNGYADSTCFRQNIFYAAEPSRFDLTSSTRNIFEQNAYIGYFKNLPEHTPNLNAENIYKEKILDVSADGYEGLYSLMDSMTIKGHSLHYINPELAERFFNTIFVETK